MAALEKAFGGGGGGSGSGSGSGGKLAVVDLSALGKGDGSADAAEDSGASIDKSFVTSIRGMVDDLVHTAHRAKEVLRERASETQGGPAKQMQMLRLLRGMNAAAAAAAAPAAPALQSSQSTGAHPAQPPPLLTAASSGLSNAERQHAELMETMASRAERQEAEKATRPGRPAEAGPRPLARPASSAGLLGGLGGSRPGSASSATGRLARSGSVPKWLPRDEDGRVEKPGWMPRHAMLNYAPDEPESALAALLRIHHPPQSLYAVPANPHTQPRLRPHLSRSETAPPPAPPSPPGAAGPPFLSAGAWTNTPASREDVAVRRLGGFSAARPGSAPPRQKSGVRGYATGGVSFLAQPEAPACARDSSQATFLTQEGHPQLQGSTPGLDALSSKLNKEREASFRRQQKLGP